MTALIELQMLEAQWSPNELVVSNKWFSIHAFLCGKIAKILYAIIFRVSFASTHSVSTRRALPSCYKLDVFYLLRLNQNKSCFWQGINSFLDCLSTFFTILSAQLVGCIANCPSLILTGKIQTKVEVVPVKEQSSLCLGCNDLLHKHSKLGQRAAEEKRNKHQTIKPRHLAEFLSIFTDFDRKCLKILPLSRFLPYFISPSQKDQVAESNFFSMKVFVIGHIPALQTQNLCKMPMKVPTVNLCQYVRPIVMLFQDSKVDGM